MIESFPENIAVTKNKITCKVIKEIKKIAESLPATPLFMPNEKGEMEIKTTRKYIKIKGKKLLKNDPKARVNGKPVMAYGKNEKGEVRELMYTLYQDDVVYINHKENLIDAFKNGGDLGMEYYVAAVNATIEEMNKPKPKVIIETFKKEFSLDESNEPLPDHVIYSGPINEVNDFILERAGINKEKFNLDIQSKKEEHDHVLIYILNPTKK